MRMLKLFMTLKDLQHQTYQQANKLFITDRNTNGNLIHFSIESVIFGMFRYIFVCKNNRVRYTKEQTIRTDHV